MADRVLLVDDDPDTLRLVSLMLQRQGYDVESASNGAQALKMIGLESPDLILLDVMMPDMDGFEVARRIRSTTSSANVPIIMFTAKAEVEDRVKGFEAGADDYLTKPTQPRELFAHMNAVLSRSKLPNSASLSTLPSERGQVIGVIANKGGLGVTTLAINLSVMLHKEYRKDVILADFRPGQGQIGLDLGYQKTDGLNYIFDKNPNEINTEALTEKMEHHPSGIKILLASHHPRDSRLVDYAEHYEKITSHLSAATDCLVIDLGSPLSRTSRKILPLCDKIVLVVEPVPTTLTQAKLLLDDFPQFGVDLDRIYVALVNRVQSGVQMSWSQVQEKLDRSLAVIFTPIPELTYQSSSNGVPVIIQHSDSLTTQQYHKLAAKLL